jgi:D-alanyl-D-alanine endopeptidase (penicillin-binding protein 7)
MKILAAVICSILLMVSFNVDAKRSHKRIKKPVKIVAVADIDKIKAKSLLVANEDSLQSYFSKNDTSIRSIASITKLMTALVVVSTNQDMTEQLTISKENEDHLKHTKSRLPVGTTLTRDQFLHLALIASENRAASVLGHSFPGGIEAFVEKMNDKAAELGMTNTKFVDPTGLYNENTSTARDLVLLAKAGHADPTIQTITQQATYEVVIKGKTQPYHNTNPLVSLWNIGVSKTGYIKEAGKCLLFQVTINAEHFIVVILDATGKGHRIAAAKSIRAWMEKKIIPTIKPNPTGITIHEYSVLKTVEYIAHTALRTDIF